MLLPYILAPTRYIKVLDIFFTIVQLLMHPIGKLPGKLKWLNYTTTISFYVQFVYSCKCY